MREDMNSLLADVAHEFAGTRLLADGGHDAAPHERLHDQMRAYEVRRANGHRATMPWNVSKIFLQRSSGVEHADKRD